MVFLVGTNLHTTLSNTCTIRPSPTHAPYDPLQHMHHTTLSNTCTTRPSPTHAPARVTLWQILPLCTTWRPSSFQSPDTQAAMDAVKVWSWTEYPL
ncbi:uncharacterized protein M421DRAFT_423462 [Didymella exigua CBS 183.55]|uniref:Uncharacterized protein n=1 Tax=Didymella exigua CBS 183.55 TaxID=1150837 RepID=A0A6A5REU6_9PLEO|nr:uncharacterized protein M421DRAFT_423462 [Didymella exigua CBS 183.55]KAF1925624.1 hypothetical protein M421DRAFT_423462 [Didymella exigua CBS 183.55]